VFEILDGVTATAILTSSLLVPPCHRSLDPHSPMNLKKPLKSTLNEHHPLIPLLLYPLFIKQDGSTPLHRAAMYGESSVVNLLLERGAILEPVNDRGNTPLHWAAGNGQKEIVILLLDNGATLEQKDYVS
jgi:ankyrin repeat protein